MTTELKRIINLLTLEVKVTSHLQGHKNRLFFSYLTNFKSFYQEFTKEKYKKSQKVAEIFKFSKKLKIAFKNGRDCPERKLKRAKPWLNGLTGSCRLKTWVRLACEFDIYQSERASSQVNTSTHRSCINGPARRLFLQVRLCRPCVYLC